MPIPASSQAAFLPAFTAFDQTLRNSSEWLKWEENANHQYAILHEGKRYPVKQLISMALKVPRYSFSGGNEANQYLRKLGFPVVRLQDGALIESGENASGAFSLDEVIDFLKSFEGFESFQKPGAEYLESERNYKVTASKRMQTLFARDDVRTELDTSDIPALKMRLVELVKSHGYSNLVSWRDYDMAFKQLLATDASDERIKQFFSATLDIYDVQKSIDDTADRLAEAMVGADAPYFKSHMWACISYFCAMLVPERYVFVKPRISDRFFKFIGHAYKRPILFVGTAYADYLQQCDQIVAEFERRGLPLTDMIDLQSAMWIVDGYELEDETEQPVESLPVRERIRQAVQALQIQSPGGVTTDDICSYMDATQPRIDGRTWAKNMVIPGDYAVWADTQAACNPSSASDPSYPKFLVCVNRDKPFRYRLRVEGSAQSTEALKTPQTIGAFFTERGLWIPEETITNYALALKTKPFVILTGISGTGKTKIAQVFAEFMCPDEVQASPMLPATTDSSFSVHPAPLLKYGYMNIKQDIQELLEVPAKGSSASLKVTTPDKAAHDVTLTNIGFSNPDASTQVRLFIKKELRAWIKQNIADGALVRFDKTPTGFSVSLVSGQRILAKSERYAFISVRPDWTDNRGLLGYFNPLTEEYVATELLRLMLRAAGDPTRPYFVILDEMNLAKVEHYFSDFLSCLESRRMGKNGVVQEGILLHDRNEPIQFEDESGQLFDIPRKLNIPLNLYFTGTVNIDETTYMFSPKVLDRANVLEFNHVDLDRYGGVRAAIEPEASVFRLSAAPSLGLPAIATKVIYEQQSASSRKVLAELNRLLTPYNLHFGYRVANEIALYLQNARGLIGPSAEAIALDLQILQKVLPKLHGSRAKLERPLQQLLAYLVTGEEQSPDQALNWCRNQEKYLETTHEQHLALRKEVTVVPTATDGESEGTVATLQQTIPSSTSTLQPARYPRAAAKVYRMVQALREQGYASFIV